MKSPLTISVVVVDSDDSCRELLRAALDRIDDLEILSEVSSMGDRQVAADLKSADILIVELNPENNCAEVLQWVERVKSHHPDIAIFFSSADKDPDLIMSAMRVGAQEYLDRPISGDKLRRAVERVSKLKSQTVRGSHGDGRIISVFSKKGGLGATTISVNIAIALARLTSQQVALLDLDLHLGDVTSFLDLKSDYSILDACGENGEVELAKLQSCLTHHSSGLYVLLEPADPVDADAVTPDHIDQILSQMQSLFTHLVIDTMHSFEPRTMVALERSDLILLPVVANISSVRAAKKTLGVLRSIGDGSEKVAVVVNRVSRNDNIRVSEIEETLGSPVFWTLPNNYRIVVDAMNSGKPIMQNRNLANIGKSFLQMAESVANWNNHPPNIRGD